MALYPSIAACISQLQTESIGEDRRQILQPLVDFIQEKVDERKPILLNFICTHNSRRSHLSQIWGQTMAHHFGIPEVFCYSGGTEATAMFPKVAETLRNAGFAIEKLSQENNPIYAIKFAENAHPVIGFSKKFDDNFNPKSEFGAIMTCSQAHEACPVVAGAAKRFPITFEDPKTFDNTPLQTEKYQERSLQIAAEMHYVFSRIKR
ncbi:protein-tyrosine-phosphatase [Marinilongibacter aquaticus]|uniref:arsenate-mycothiol transferase ArsC n=1 Tax=Marinilongibacter aquaticus TaxID=2975157 RepID=UPI0021BD8D5C|nr:protein-tyrosine-phosphatase [Marinilongibacter aquaticus]UBM60299.1 protein-tyrosine-phosphatase [Marinilongibacter aquaticus]